MSELAAITIPAETSGFSYTPPVSEASPDELAQFNDALNSSIDEISAEHNPKPEVQVAAETETPTEETPAAEVPTEDAADPNVARGMQQLVQREVQLQARESQLAQREAHAKATDAELVSLRAVVPTKDLLEKFDLSPSDALKAMGKDPETVVRLMIAEQLHAKGQPVPEGLQKFIERANSERRIAALEAQIAQKDRVAQEAQVYSTVQSQAREYVKSVDGKKMPSLALLTQADPELAHSELMEEIDRQAAKNPQGQLTYEAAATQAESRLARLVKALSKGSPASTAVAATKQEGGPKTNTPPQTKTPAKPIAPWKVPKDDFNAALLEAEREFHVVEARNKAARG